MFIHYNTIYGEIDFTLKSFVGYQKDRQYKDPYLDRYRITFLSWPRLNDQILVRCQSLKCESYSCLNACLVRAIIHCAGESVKSFQRYFDLNRWRFYIGRIFYSIGLSWPCL